MPQDGLYQGWFCPFAQRAWIAVLYRGLDIDVHEVSAEDLKNKTPQWLQISPRGAVPALVHNGRSIYESSLILEYLDDAWPAQPGAPRIFPSDPYERFQARLWHEHIDKKLMVPFYQLLKCKDPEEQTKMKEQLLEDLKYMFDKKPSDSAFYLGDEPCNVDFMLVPFVIRYKNVLKQLRNFEIPMAGFEKFHGWYAKMMALDCVKKTLCDDQKLTDLYEQHYTN